jgi:hypothetical protein
MKKLIFVLYPFLVACYPILALRNHNIIYVDLASIIRTLLIAILLTAIIWFLLHILFRDWTKSGIATSLAMIVIFSYGHIHIQSASVFGEPIRHTYLVTILGVLYLVIVWLVTHRPSRIETFRNFLAVTAVALVAMSLGQSIYYEYSTYRAARIMAAQDNKSNESTSPANHPDIYLIVLDAHTRTDVLKEKFDYDNSFFIQELTELGFYVASCSQSNYASTNLSLSALFSMDYIPSNLSSMARLPPFKETTVRKTLASQGYSIITFENRASGHFDLQEDVRLSHNQLLLGELNLMGGLNEFEKVMLQTSVTKLFLDTRLIPEFNEDGLTQLENYEHYQQTLFILSKLPEVPHLKSPKFVLVHILVPHAPFVFTADGGFKNPEDGVKPGYSDNARFIDQSILTAIKAILTESQQPPIILLMGDHGPPPGKYATREDRMSILNAYYTDRKSTTSLYASITPVNSFRVIFTEYFGGSYPLLEDVSHFAYKLKQINEAPIVENVCIPAAP